MAEYLYFYQSISGKWNKIEQQERTFSDISAGYR